MRPLFSRPLDECGQQLAGSGGIAIRIRVRWRRLALIEGIDSETGCAQPFDAFLHKRDLRSRIPGEQEGQPHEDVINLSCLCDGVDLCREIFGGTMVEGIERENDLVLIDESGTGPSGSDIEGDQAHGTYFAATSLAIVAFLREAVLR